MRDIIDFIIDRLNWIVALLLLWYIFLPLFIGECTDPNALNYNKDAWFTSNQECVYKPLTAKEHYDLNKWLNSLDDIDCESLDYWSECIEMGCHWEAFDEYSGYCTDDY